MLLCCTRPGRLPYHRTCPPATSGGAQRPSESVPSCVAEPRVTAEPAPDNKIVEQDGPPEVLASDFKSHKAPNMPFLC